MIYLPATPQQTDRQALYDHLCAELFPGASSPEQRPAWIEDVAAALVGVWADLFGGAPLPPRLYALMAARTCWQLGQHDEARRVVHVSCSGNDAERDALLGLLACDGPSLSLCHCLTTGLVRAVGTSVPPGAAVWILDIDRLLPGRGEPVEMHLLQRIRVVIDQLSEVWDADGGAGALGLASSRGGLVLRGEAAPFSRDVLDRIRTARGWQTSPDVRWVEPRHFSAADR